MPIDSATRRRNKKGLANAERFAKEQQGREGAPRQEVPETPATSPASQDSEAEGEGLEHSGERVPDDGLPLRAEGLRNDMAGSYGDTWRHAAAAAAEGSWMRARVFLSEMRKVAGVNYSVASSRA